MGRLAAMDMLNQTDLDTALSWHLTFNIFPPVPTSMVETCKDAIALANNGAWEADIILPDGVTYRGRTVAAAWKIIENFRLEAFLDEEEA